MDLKAELFKKQEEARRLRRTTLQVEDSVEGGAERSRAVSDKVRCSEGWALEQWWSPRPVGGVGLCSCGGVGGGRCFEERLGGWGLCRSGSTPGTCYSITCCMSSVQ